MQIIQESRLPARVDVERVITPWYDPEAPGMALLLMRYDKILHARGYGLADLKEKTPIAPDTVFDLASVSKQFTAMAIMILAERGAIKFTDLLIQFFPQFPPYAKEITIRHLLDHTSGLPDYMEALESSGKLKDREKPYEPSSQEVLELLSKEMKLKSAPGEKFEYNNSAYMVLGQIIGKVSGVPYPRFLKENIFQPLGMQQSIVLDETKPAVKNRAISYAFDGKSYGDADYSPLNWIYGDGGVQSTILDVARWYNGLAHNKLVSDTTLKQAFTSTKLNNGKETGYGYGFYIGKSLGQLQVSHTGSWAGFRNAVRYFPSIQMAVIMLTNTDRYDYFVRSYLTHKVAKLLVAKELEGQPAVTLKPEQLQKYAGKYEMEGEPSMELVFKEGNLHYRPSSFPDIRMVSLSEVKFVLRDAEDETFVFEKDSNGNVVSVKRTCSIYGNSSSAISEGKKIS